MYDEEIKGQGPEEETGCEEKEVAPEVPATETPEILDPVKESLTDKDTEE